MAMVPNLAGTTPLDKPFDHYNRTNAGSPAGSVTPEFAGERVLDTTNSKLYQALGVASNTWVLLTP